MTKEKCPYCRRCANLPQHVKNCLYHPAVANQTRRELLDAKGEVKPLQVYVSTRQYGADAQVMRKNHGNWAAALAVLGLEPRPRGLCSPVRKPITKHKFYGSTRASAVTGVRMPLATIAAIEAIRTPDKSFNRVVVELLNLGLERMASIASTAEGEVSA